MESNFARSGARTFVRRTLILGLWATFAALCLFPYTGRLRHPSLYSDDIVRIEQVQTMPLRMMLVRPFNEHLAPVFEGVTWVTWQMAGRRLARAPWAFTLVSYL